MNYYCHTTQRIYYSIGPCVYYKPIQFNELCAQWWEIDKIWVESFGHVHQNVGWEWRYLDIIPGPQTKLWWCKELIPNPIFLDVKKSFGLLRIQMEQYIDKITKWY